MKKIVFITFGHWGSTLPLAKIISEKGFEVDYYIECFRTEIRSIEATDVPPLKLTHLHGELPIKNLGSLKEFCPRVRFYYLRLVPPMASHRVLSRIAILINRILIWYYSFTINKRRCDNILLVGRNTANHFVWYHKYLHGQILTCLHEVCSHFNPDFRHPTNILRFLFQNKKPIVVHSNNSYVDIQKFSLCNKEKVYHIDFGLFETWKFCRQDDALASLVDKDYVLFIGGISAYKGLDVLYATITYLRDNHHNIRFVIAGKGDVPVMKKLRNMENVTIINKFLTNIEFATLMRRCRTVICPYKTMSQSGIPQSAFVFGKPIIASNLKGFRELFKKDDYGILCNVGDETEFASAILKMYDNGNYRLYCNKVDRFEETSYSFNWNSIAEEYIKLCNK